MSQQMNGLNLSCSNTYAAILSRIKDPAEFRKLARLVNAADSGVNTRITDRPSKKQMGKNICALRSAKPDLDEHRRRGHYGELCATAYGAYVLAPNGAARKITEDLYDKLQTDVLERAAHIVDNVAYETWRTKSEHQAVVDAANILRSPWPSVEELRKICERIQKRTVNEETGEEATPFVYLTPEQYAAQKVAKANAASLSCASDSEPASRSKDVFHSELAVTVEKRATSTPDMEEARLLAIHAAKILAALASNLDEHGQRRFSDKTIAAWTAPGDPAPVVTIESMKTEYVAAIGQLQEKENKLKEAGIDPPQLPVTPQRAIPNFMPAPVPQANFDPRWRNAEKVVLDLLRKKGWQIVDVSGQKAGCDFKGHTSEGEEVFVDVKLISRPNEPFTLTDDEMLLAREKGAAYRVALVKTTDTQLQVAFVSDPANKLEYKQKCRAVYWEFAEYEFRPAMTCPLE